MRLPRWALPVAVLTLAAACGQGSNSSASWNTIDTTTHDSFFLIAAGSKHALGSDSPAITCNSCHGGGNSFKQFDCLSCHAHSDQAALALGHRGVSQFAYASASCYSCHASGTAGGTIPSGLINDPARDVTVNAQIPSYVDTSISSLSPQTETLPMPMDHASTQVGAAAFANCANCHGNANAGSFYPGNLHSSLVNLNLAQPSACVGCHAITKPIGFVGPTASNPTRTPASSEMKHDAVLWNNGLPTAMSAVPEDCAVCHLTPSMSLSATWGISRTGTSPALFHASLRAANLPQPASCVDCHANSRPNGVLTVPPTNLQFDHTAPAALVDCASCHQSSSASQWTSWAGGKFHLAGDATPVSCLPCHAAERPTTTSTWASTTYTSLPFDYVTNAQGITHGAGQDCVVCHAGPGTGAWGGTQNWVRGYFAHGASTISSNTCITCHSSQRPDLQPGTTPAAMATLLGFDHSINGTGDCFGCHQATVTANRYQTYFNTTQKNSGDWQGGQAYPGATLIGSTSQFVTVTEIALHRSGTNNLVTSTTSTSATLLNEMLHTSAAIPSQVSPGPASTPDYTKCWHCHTSSGTTVTSFANGQFHPALTSYSATPGGTPTPLPQPTTQCLDCHAQMRPAGIVEKAASDLQPMDHNALFTSAVTISGVSVTGVAGIECAVCHKSPGNTWTDGTFHKNIGAAVPQDCTTCHYPLMADAAKSDVSSGVNYTMKHTSGQLTFQNCQVCHASALSKSANTPAALTLWQTGAFHPSLASQPTACLACHAVSEPAASASTQSSWSYTFANGGGTTSNQAQWMNHGSTDVAGKDCITCHATDAKQSGSAWSKATYFHTVVTSPTGCQKCHGLTNGGGSVAGTNNNLPAGLTASSTLTMASNDASTGVPAGTHDQINHSDINVSSHDCNFCHTQAGTSTVAGIQGHEWAQASFHSHFTGTALVLNTTTGRCSNCHMNVKPASGFSTDHSSFTSASGTEDCATCHSYPGTGTPSSPNWYGAAGTPAYINVGGFTIPVPPATAANATQLGIVNLPHPTVTASATCSSCHTGGVGGKDAIGYDHASSLISTNCGSCHEAGSNLVGTAWNNASSQSAGAGDTRPFTLTSLSVCNLTSPGPHFYPSDCSMCHKNVPSGTITHTTTGSAYTAAWKWTHPPKQGGTSSFPCNVCHKQGGC